MSERDLPNMDDVELPDIPDDEELDSADNAEGDAAAEGMEAEAGGALGGRFGPLLGKLAAVLAPLAALLAPLLARVGAIAAPVARIAAPIASATAPVRAIAGPLVERVPRPILAGVGSFLGVLLVIVLLASAVAGGRGSAEASTAAKAPAAKSAAAAAELPKPTPKPAYTPTPSGPTPTATPVIWEERGSSWIAHGVPLPKQSDQHLVPRRILRLIDDPREEYTLVTRFQVLTATGPLAPWWGIVLAYQDESHHVTLYFSTDSYNGNKPAAGVMLANGAGARPVGPPVALPEIPWWGRDTHEVRVTVGEKIETWLNGYPMGTWQNPRQVVTGGPKGLFLIGPSKMRFDAFELE